MPAIVPVGGSGWQRPSFSRVVIAIPVKNEAGEIAGCLRALAAQKNGRLDGVTLCLNNCTDGSAAAVQRMAESLPFPVSLLDVELAPQRACAGVARRIAMDRGLISPARTVLFSAPTPMDGRSRTGWRQISLRFSTGQTQ